MYKRVLWCLIVLFIGLPAVAVPAAAADSVDRVLVRFIAGKDPRSVVRAGAWSALLSEDSDTAVSHFLDSDYPFLVNYAAANKQRHIDFCHRVLAVYTVQFAPEVNAAARAAAAGSDAQRAAFVSGGFAAAEQRDRVARERSGEQAAALLAVDWDFVRALAQDAPGLQVRAAASWATRTGATDTDLVDFFAYGWASGGRLDLESHRRELADSDVRWLAVAKRLVAEARAAEQAAREAAEDFAEQARATAAAAWREVGDQAQPASSVWTDAQRIAAAQASSWAGVAAAAAVATGPNWAAVLDPALTAGAEWQADDQHAQERTAYWQGLLAQAREGEARMTTG
ncbi:hypothetical protein [Actinokineospora pegani]|uniref:hypothetical protein n=1 Tax=Actinokineospora pegani TaxID=2654637 RepID=UPI001F4509E9|nr:hypothetical protein [Actinokineospora pegani]